ncbi:MAG: DUF427 domain-containing protein [Actinomycetota bacterium]|nr:DUF427 domain-containing protein [Actinomycetota bacterium]
MKPQRIEPGPGQESVWDYPRPPRLEPSRRHVRVVFANEAVAESGSALRVCETAGPPVYYVPPQDVRMDLLVPVEHASFCEWKGHASYFDLDLGGRVSHRAAWSYAQPTEPFRQLQGFIAFYPGRVDAAYLDDERVRPQPGDFYGGWITDDIVGPFKGIPGSDGW